MQMSFQSLPEIFAAFERQTVLVIGDVMIDSYLWGKVDRISPEAPVPVVNVQKREKRLGGAANVALNLHALGAKSILCSVVGQDADAETFMDLLAEENLDTRGIAQSAHRPTTVKHRILAGHQHILRVDQETTNLLSEAESNQLLTQIKHLLPECQALIFEDYDKGVISPHLISEVVALAKSYGIPSIVDPKKRNFMAYQGVSLFKPNLKELKEGLKIEFDVTKIEELREAVKLLRERLNAEQALVTLSEHGVFIDDGLVQYHEGAHLREIADVSGAGDTLVSVAALCMALGLAPAQTAALANLAGGLVCEHLGVTSIDKSTFLAEAQKHKLFLAW